jgi:aldehyde:ferredoxin oxidoreductase
MSETNQIYVYAERVLRVNLTSGKITQEVLDEAILRKYVGGTTLGMKFLYDEVPPGVAWFDPNNRLFLGCGPLSGTSVPGSGAIAVVTKGALTNGASATQANGFFGAYLRLSGFGCIIIQGAASDWVYLYIHDGTAELRDAKHLINKDIREMGGAIRNELGREKGQTSVLGIGPAGENLVKFAGISVDNGHFAAHNGVGAVMGSKKFKAVVVTRGKATILFKNRENLSKVAKEIREEIKADDYYSAVSAYGTLNVMKTLAITSGLPIKNYTTNVIDIDKERFAKYSAGYIYSHFEIKPNPCWACQAHHALTMRFKDGPYRGQIFEEPDYESLASWSTLVGIKDLDETIMLAELVDRLGMDTNEAGWVIAWVMECYEKGILSKQSTDGLEMTWGNHEAIKSMLNRIARRQGFGDVLAEGVMRASRYVGSEAVNLAIFTQKGNTPRTHDHRAIWFEMFDTCVSNSGTLETHTQISREMVGLPQFLEPFNHEDVSSSVAKTKGAMEFEDSMVTCRFNTRAYVPLLCKAVNAATGWDLTFEECMTVGRRAINLMRVFNLRHGISAELDAPSTRYGSIQVDGPIAGRSIMPSWDKMLANYYSLMGWDKKGKPLPETLKGLGLENLLPDLAKVP